MNRYLLCGTMLSAFAAASASAQTAPAETEDSAGLSEIVVTAQKRSENLQDVPIAISAVGGDRVDALHATRLSDLTGVAPNFSVERANGAVYIRGVGGGGRNIGFGGRAGVYLDGVYIGQVASLNQTLLDIDRIEVLRGPQGHLFGRNTVSGAVNIVTRAPSNDFGGEISGGVGNSDYRSVGVQLNLPVVEDKIMAKASFGYERRDGFTRNLFNGDRTIGSLDTQSYRFGVRLKPTERLTIDLSADYMRDFSFRGGPEAISGLTGGGSVDPGAPAPFETNTNTPRFKHAKTGGTSANIDYEIGDHVLTSITAFRDSRLAIQADNDYSSADFIHTLYVDRFSQFSEELRIASPTDGRLRYVAGVFYMDETAKTRRTAFWGVAAGALGLGIPLNSSTPSSARIGTRSIAAFGSIDFDLLDQLTLNLGGRYTHERRKILFNLDGSNSGLVGIATLNNFRDQDTENRFTPSLGVTFRPVETVNIYAKYATGFKSGGWNVDFLNRNQVRDLNGDGRADFAFDTETVKSYEVGLKAEMFDRRLRTNLAAFIADYDNYQINRFYLFPGGITVIQLSNAAKVHTKGVEASIEAAPVRDLKLTFDAAYMDASFKSFPGGGAAGADASGNRLPFSPKWSGSVSAEYGLDLPGMDSRLSLFGQYSYRSRTFSGQENLANQRLENRKLVNARITFAHMGSGLEFSLWGVNLTNDLFTVNRAADFLGTRFVERGEPRTYGIEAKYRF